MQTLLRTPPEDLPELLLALGFNEAPLIDDDHDLGLSWEMPKTGIEISFDDRQVSTIFLYGPAERETNYYHGELPLGLIWDTSFDDAIAAFGNPSRYSHGGEDPDGPLGPIPPWVRYDGANHCIHLQFTPDKTKISRVAIMTSERAP
ncbi:MAG: hypothetical protein WBD20_24770 [Pirellulaceae bacterium]